MMTLQGHEAAVWSVQLMPEHGLMLTGDSLSTPSNTFPIIIFILPGYNNSIFACT